MISICFVTDDVVLSEGQASPFLSFLFCTTNKKILYDSWFDEPQIANCKFLKKNPQVHLIIIIE